MKAIQPIYYLLSTLLVYLLFLSCNNTTDPIDFCEILRRDQSHVNSNKSDENFEKDRAIRGQIMKENFDGLMQHIEQEGLPPIAVYESDSCLRWAVQMTLIHAAQGNQIGLFSKKNIELLQVQIEQGNLDVELLKRSIIVMLITSELCSQAKENMLYAIRNWGLENEYFQGKTFGNFIQKATFVDC